MAKFIDRNKEQKIKNPTVFDNFVGDGILIQSTSEPNDFETVEYLFTDAFGYDFFKVCNTFGNWFLYIGKKGYEFN